MLLANYVTSAWRNILRHKLFSIINIMGLAIGLAAVMLIALYVRYETSYDSFWKNADNIYRMQMTISMPGRDPVDALFAPLMAAPALKQDFSEIIHVARAFPHSASFIQKNNRSRESVKFVDPEILEIFQFDVLAGDIKTSLNDNRSLVLNETLSKKYFGDLTPIGKTITLDLGTFKKDYKVGAVIKNKRENSHVEFSAMLGLFESDWANDPIMFKSWLRPYAHTFFTVKSGTNIDIFNEQMGDFIDRHYPAPMSGDTNKKPSEEVSFSALNIQDVHLNASGFGDDTPSGDYTTILVFSLVAALILLIAIFNFMNLTTARATQRAKEISLRKVMGAARKHLIVQFISESILLTFLALLISLVFVETSLPLLNEMIGKSLILDYLGLDAVMIFILTALVGIFAGFYPAFILSSFRPTENLKSNKSSETRGSVSIRNSLVIIQFTVSVFLFVTTAIIYFQIRFTENFDYGFDKENTLTIKNIRTDGVKGNLDALLAELEKLPNVTNFSTSTVSPGVTIVTPANVRTEDMAAGSSISIASRTVGYNFFKTYNIKILTGREFASGRNDFTEMSEQTSVSNVPVNSVIINELAARQLGFNSPEEAIGKRLIGTEALDGRQSKNYQVIGVTSNFHFSDLKERVMSAMYILDPGNPSVIALRFTGNSQALIMNLSAIWQKLYPDTPFNYSFSKDALAEKYNAEKGQMTMFAAFSGLAIFIACLGLFGLASFTAERRTKEIGIRKVFGAEVWQIVKLLVWQFSKPVLIANIIAWPIAYLAMSRWLESFVYRIDDMVIIALCLMAGLTALLIAWATVAGNSYAVARQNPIKALRYE